MNHKKEVHKLSAISLVVSVTGAATLARLVLVLVDRIEGRR